MPVYDFEKKDLTKLSFKELRKLWDPTGEKSRKIEISKEKFEELQMQGIEENLNWKNET